MDTILQNRIVITDDEGNPREYFIEKPLPYPEADSDRSVASSYLYQLERKLVHFLGRGVTNQIVAGNVNVPTSSAVWDKINEINGINPSNYPDGCTVVYVKYNSDGTLCYVDPTNQETITINTSGNQGNATINAEYIEKDNALKFTTSSEIVVREDNGYDGDIDG